MGSAESTGSSGSGKGSGRSTAAATAAAAAHTIAGECERLFCGTLAAAFLGEGRAAAQDPLAVGALTIVSPPAPASGRRGGGAKLVDLRKDSGLPSTTAAGQRFGVPTPPSSLSSSEAALAEDGGVEEEARLVGEYVEVWTYTSGLRFRGFVAGEEGERALFVFFDREVVGKDLKKGLMALLELASTPTFACDKLVACLDRGADDKTALEDMVRDLGWVGFEPTTLEPWCSGSVDITSSRWLMLAMAV